MAAVARSAISHLSLDRGNGGRTNLAIYIVPGTVLRSISQTAPHSVVLVLRISAVPVDALAQVGANLGRPVYAIYDRTQQLSVSCLGSPNFVGNILEHVLLRNMPDTKVYRLSRIFLKQLVSP